MVGKALEYIYENYGVRPEYLWASDKDSAAIRNPHNKKWFAVLMCNLPKNKFGIDSNEKVDVMNLKCNTDFMFSVVDNKRIFRGFHMNKRHWISVFLDGSVEMDELSFLINMSYSEIEKIKRGKNG